MKLKMSDLTEEQQKLLMREDKDIQDWVLRVLGRKPIVKVFKNCNLTLTASFFFGGDEDGGELGMSLRLKDSRGKVLWSDDSYYEVLFDVVPCMESIVDDTIEGILLDDELTRRLLRRLLS